MQLLVMGGAGFIGSNFIHHILSTYPDYQVINLDVLTYAGNLENLKAWGKGRTLPFCQRQHNRCGHRGSAHSGL